MTHLLPLYQCHKKVRAAKIVGIEPCDNELRTGLLLDGAGRVVVDTAWKTRNPALAIGGYFVEYPDSDYSAYSPAAPFEGGYTLVGAPDPAPDADDEMMDLYRMDCRVGIRYGSPLHLVDDILLHALRAMLAQDRKSSGDAIPPAGSVITLMMSIDRSGCNEAAEPRILLPGLGGVGRA
jgi:hypothetical protein